MTDDREERIRQRAHEIWEREGRPDGLHQQHWNQATSEIDAEDLQGGSEPPHPRNPRQSPDTQKVAGGGPSIADHSKDAIAQQSGRQSGAYVKE